MKNASLLLTVITAGLMLATAAGANETKPATKPDLVKGQAIATQVCSACHTADGTRGLAANPILQGQHVEYLRKQLHDFQSGKRNNAVMKGMAAGLSEEDIFNVSAFYASKKPVLGAAEDKTLVSLGEKIYRGGIAERQIAACASCHSPNGAGMPVQYPRLAGQHSDYIEAQLKAYRDGSRANGPMMPLVAAKMNDKEIKAVSDYIAGLR